jgi:hypothetical protein
MTIAESHFDGREMEMKHKMLRREFALIPGLVAPELTHLAA